MHGRIKLFTVHSAKILRNVWKFVGNLHIKNLMTFKQIICYSGMCLCVHAFCDNWCETEKTAVNNEKDHNDKSISNEVIYQQHQQQQQQTKSSWKITKSKFSEIKIQFELVYAMLCTQDTPCTLHDSLRSSAILRSFLGDTWRISVLSRTVLTGVGVILHQKHRIEPKWKQTCIKLSDCCGFHPFFNTHLSENSAWNLKKREGA